MPFKHRGFNAKSLAQNSRELVPYTLDKRNTKYFINNSKFIPFSALVNYSLISVQSGIFVAESN